MGDQAEATWKLCVSNCMYGRQASTATAQQHKQACTASISGDLSTGPIMAPEPAFLIFVATATNLPPEWASITSGGMKRGSDGKGRSDANQHHTSDDAHTDPVTRLLGILCHILI